MENIKKELQRLVGSVWEVEEFGEDLILELNVITAPLLEEDDITILNFKDSERVIEVDGNNNRQEKILMEYCFETELSDLCIEVRTEKFFGESGSMMEKVSSVYMY